MAICANCTHAGICKYEDLRMEMERKMKEAIRDIFAQDNANVRAVFSDPEITCLRFSTKQYSSILNTREMAADNNILNRYITKENQNGRIKR